MTGSTTVTTCGTSFSSTRVSNVTHDGGRIRRELQATGRLGGGGTDLPSYYRDHEGFLIAAAIDKYLNAIRSWIHVLEPLTGYFILAERLFAEPKVFSEAWNFGPAARRDAVYIPEGCAHGFQTLVDDCEPSTYRRSGSRPHVHGKKIVDVAL